MANSYLTPTVITRETLMRLTNKLSMASHCYTALEKQFHKIGTTITVRLPNKFRGANSATIALNDLTEPSVQLTISNQFNIGMSWPTKDETLTIDEFSKRYVEPATDTLANMVDAAMCALANDVYNTVGTPGVTPATFTVLGAAGQRLTEEGVPRVGRVGILNPAAEYALGDGLRQYMYNPSLSKELTESGFLGRVNGTDLYGDQNVLVHTTGHFTTGCTPLCNFSGGNGVACASGASTITADGCTTTTNTVTVGDVFTLGTVGGSGATAPVFAVNPVSGASTGVLRQFVITTAATSTGGGDLLLTFSPSLIDGTASQATALGAYQTVSVLPANNCPINFLGTQDTAYPQNLIYHPNAFALVCVPLEMPENTWGARVSDPQTGLSIRLTKQWAIGTDIKYTRLDLLCGVKTIYPALACRLAG